MFKSVTKWFGVDSIDTPEESENPDNAVGIAEPDLEGKNESVSSTAAATKESSTTERDLKQRDGEDNGQKESPAPTSTDLNTSQESVLEDDDTFQLLEEASAVAFDTAKQVGSMLFSFGRSAGSTLVEQASKLKQAVQERQLLGDFYVEQEKLTTEMKEQKKKEGDAVAPWVGYHEEEAMKQQILSLSTERKTFLKHPPSDASYVFDFATAYPVALATLKEDDNLQKMRFELVPKKVSEEAFWLNYFYRVSLIKQSVQLGTLQQLQKAKDEKTPIVSTAAAGGGGEQTTTEEKKADEEADDTKKTTPLTSTHEKTPTQTQSLNGGEAHVQQNHDTLLLQTTKRVDNITPAALVATASKSEKDEKEQEEEEEEEDLEDVDDEEWERVLQQEVDEFLKVEGYEDHSTATPTTTKANPQSPDDEDPELLDLM